MSAGKGWVCSGGGRSTLRAETDEVSRCARWDPCSLPVLHPAMCSYSCYLCLSLSLCGVPLTPRRRSLMSDLIDSVHATVSCIWFSFHLPTHTWDRADVFLSSWKETTCAVFRFFTLDEVQWLYGSQRGVRFKQRSFLYECADVLESHKSDPYAVFEVELFNIILPCELPVVAQPIQIPALNLGKQLHSSLITMLHQSTLSSWDRLILQQY